MKHLFRHVALTSPQPSDTTTPSNPILFMNPSAAWMVSMIDNPTELEMCLDQLSLSLGELVFIPINDAQDPSIVGGGSHWSLLVFHRASNAFFHMDSVSSSSNNRSYAINYAKNLYPVLHVEELTGYSFVDVKSSPQTNGYDCGIYLISNAEVTHNFFLARKLTSKFELGELEEALKVEVTSASVKNKRKLLLGLVDEFSKNHSH